MRYVFVSVFAVTLVASAASTSGCKGDDQPVATVCKDFCDTLVEAMDKSDYYNVKVSSAEKACRSECTDTVEGIKDSKDQEDVEDCVECAEKRIDKDDDWVFDTLHLDVGSDCEKACFNDFDDLEPWEEYPWVMFWTDFIADFDEHYSDDWPNSGADGDSDSDVDGDADSDADSDSDTDTDAFCPGYTGSDDCCTLANTCSWEEDNACDCDGTCFWDVIDCA